jgi:hypothetical protein
MAECGQTLPEDAGRPPAPGRWFPLAVLAVVLVLAAIGYLYSVRRADDAYMESHLAIASEMTKLHLSSVIERELVLMEKLADSQAVRHSFLSPHDEGLRQAAETEIKTYQFLLKEGDVFWSSSKDRILRTISASPPRRLEPGEAGGDWYDQTIRSERPYHISTTRDPASGRTTVFLNVPVQAFSPGEPALGLVGSAIEIDHLADMINGSFELINPRFLYYICDANYFVISSNDDRFFNKHESILDFFPQIEPEISKPIHFTNSSDRVVKSGLDEWLLSRVPGFNWHLVIYYRLPAIGAVRPFVDEVFLTTLALALLAIAAFWAYLWRLSRRASRWTGLLQAALAGGQAPPAADDPKAPAAAHQNPPL